MITQHDRRERRRRIPVRFNLLPKEEHYFDLIERAAGYLVEGAAVLEDLSRHYEDVDAKINRLGGIEHACDEILHTTLDKLNKIYITPIDREDIHALMIRLDDVLDMTNGAAKRLVLFGVTRPRPPVLELATVILKQVQKVEAAVKLLRNSKKLDAVSAHCIEIHRLENEADEIMERVVGELFRQETNAVELLRWKEIYETMEAITDCAEDVANVLQGITVKLA